jgi:hypothetical protein
MGSLDYARGKLIVMASRTKRGTQGIAERERALALNPNLASAHTQIGLAKLFDGHPEETESMRRCASVLTTWKPVFG